MKVRVGIVKDNRERQLTLLKASYNLLKKQDVSPYTLNLLEETIVYEGAEYDGYCLMEEIAEELNLI